MISRSRPDQETLLKAISRGDTAALSKFYDLHSDDIFGRCFAMLADRSEAEDATQEIFIKIWDRAGAFDPRKGPAQSWLSTIIRNHCIDLLRKHPHREILDSAQDENTVLPLKFAENRVDSQNIMSKLDEVAPNAADIIRLQFFKGYTFPEISDATGLPEPTVKARSRRALIAIRQQVEKPKNDK
jgi:RNA polymerase sigma-70 factor, ECF subfamily